MKTRPWITVQDLDDATHIDSEDAVQAASFVLFMLSGQKYPGIWEITEQYFCEVNGAPNGCLWDAPSNRWVNTTWGFYAHPVGPSGRSTVLRPGKRFRLQHRPVREITEITIGGTILDPSEYSLLNGELVSRTGSWGVCDAPIVTYEYGRNAPALGRMAARRLANELLLASKGSADCALPANVTSIQRQGLAIDIWDPNEFLDKGKTGLYEVDLFIATSNPAGAKKPARIFSPDSRRGYRSS